MICNIFRRQRLRKVLHFNFEECRTVFSNTSDKIPLHSHCYQVNDCQVKYIKNKRRMVFLYWKKIHSSFCNQIFLLTKGWQCHNKCESPLIIKISLLQSFMYLIKMTNSVTILTMRMEGFKKILMVYKHCTYDLRNFKPKISPIFHFEWVTYGWFSHILYVKTSSYHYTQSLYLRASHVVVIW